MSDDTPVTVSQLEALLAEMSAMRAELDELRRERALFEADSALRAPATEQPAVEAEVTSRRGSVDHRRLPAGCPPGRERRAAHRPDL